MGKKSSRAFIINFERFHHHYLQTLQQVGCAEFRPCSHIRSVDCEVGEWFGELPAPGGGWRVVGGLGGLHPPPCSRARVLGHLGVEELEGWRAGVLEGWRAGGLDAQVPQGP